jgi:hypothetical protein
MSRLHHEDAIARRQRVHQRCFPRASAGRRINHHRAGALKDALDPFQHALAKLCKVRPAMVDDRHVHRAQDAVWHRRRARDIEEMAAGFAGGVLGHGIICPTVRL